MIPEKKIKEIRKRLIRGFPEGEIITELRQEGYSNDDISRVFDSLQNSKKKHPASRDYPLWYLLSFGFVILGIALLSVHYLWLTRYAPIFIAIGIAGIVIYLIKKGQSDD